jgi:hypothetical protein
LQFQFHGELIGFRLAHARLPRIDLLHRAEQVLDVMPDLVCDDVSLCEVAGRAEFRLHVAIEGEIDVNLLVARTIEGADARARHAARRARLPVKRVSFGSR